MLAMMFNQRALRQQVFQGSKVGHSDAAAPTPVMVLHSADERVPRGWLLFDVRQHLRQGSDA
jgi:hypothetical protein